MVIAVLFAGTVQVTVYYIVHMVTVRYCQMSAVSAMRVRVFVFATFVLRRTATFLAGINVFIHMIIMYEMKMSIVQIANMIVMLHGLVTATSAMSVIMAGVCLASHFSLLIGICTYFQ